jgi:hypothetical protein
VESTVATFFPLAEADIADRAEDLVSQFPQGFVGQGELYRRY